MNVRATRQILKRATAALTGRKRGPDHDPAGKRRVPRRDSYEVGRDPRANPWKPIGDGSVRQGLIYREALIQAAKEWRLQLWHDYPLAEVRAARERHASLSAELDAYAAGAPAEAGRPAAARIELGEIARYLTAADNRLRRMDVTVLEALLRTLDFATGRLFPSIDAIAASAGCHRNTVVAALRRLRDHGFIAWVRRTIRTGNDNQFAPQREQTSNAYYFDHRARMAGRVFQRYCQILVTKLRRLGAVLKVIADRGQREVQDPALRQALTALGAGVALRESAST